jgi:hypothetical protein
MGWDCHRHANNQTTIKRPFLNELIRIDFFERAIAVKVARMRTGDSTI